MTRGAGLGRRRSLGIDSEGAFARANTDSDAPAPHDTPFENLDSGRFQELCQSLLIKEYPNVQCLPIGQPDPYKWLEEIVHKEAPKVSKLIPKGAKAYYLVTNVRGTAHPDVGSIDKVNKILSDAIEIPSSCWWRDDLNRRLDNAWDLKWAYPEIITALDLLRYILETGLATDKHRLISVIVTFVQGQYIKDEVVRFKQGGLIQSKLLDLFIDVPVRAVDHPEGRRQANILNYLIGQYGETDDIDLFDNTLVSMETSLFHFRGRQQAIGAARALLHPIIQEEVPQIVLEGAPGQGKSTIVQYVCQMHRMRILNENMDIVPPYHRPASLRIPIKIDLRDFATWLNGKDPFSSAEENGKPEDWYKSLEAFLAYQIRYDSGGTDFSVDDLQAVAKFSSLLLVLDGFDEVADISKRQEVVTEGTACIRRLRVIAASFQVIITSRPAAFANSPGFSEKLFPHYELASLTINQINDYASRWVVAQALDNRDRIEVKKILNQRTALYDSYVARFFDREADKNVDVRENRILLINIHGYLAWILHSEAEQGQERGSVSVERLKRLLTDYLSKEDLDVGLAEKLSVSTVERIFFLVSRVQGTFEFEVQPLREYFAARYLYKTAPHPSPGVSCHGTIVDRFEAISMNFYWLNVTRFYAGFYNPGELPSLVYQLQDLAQKEGYCYIDHPKVLAATLLSDSVFAQHKRAMKDVLFFVLDKLGVRYFSTARDQYSYSEASLALPKDCGQNELVKYCFAELHNDYAEDCVTLFCNLIKANSTVQEIKELWYKEAINAVGEIRNIWLHYGFYLEVLPRLNQKDLEELLSDDPDNLERIILLYRAGQLEKVVHFEKYCKILVDSVLSGDFVAPSRQKYKTIPELFIELENLPMEQNLSSSDFNKLVEIIKLVQTEQNRTVKEWASELAPWDNIVELSRSLWGEQWLHFHFANVASGIRSYTETYKDFSNLLDKSKSLCKRTRYARLRAGVPEWWKNQLEGANTEQEKMFVLLVLLTWGSFNTIVHLIDSINSIFNQMSADNWQRIFRSLKQTASLLDMDEGRNNLAIDITTLPSDLSARIVTLFGLRTKLADAAILYQKYLLNYQGSDKFTLQFCQDTAFEMAQVDPNYWQQSLTTIANSYAKGVILEPRFFGSIPTEQVSFPIQVAEEIAVHPEKYPLTLTPLVEVVFKKIVAQNIMPVGEIAKNQHWFEE